MCKNFQFIGLCLSIFVVDRVKNDLLIIIYIVKYEDVHSNLAMTVCHTQYTVNFLHSYMYFKPSAHPNLL